MHGNKYTFKSFLKSIKYFNSTAFLDKIKYFIRKEEHKKNFVLLYELCSNCF